MQNEHRLQCPPDRPSGRTVSAAVKVTAFSAMHCFFRECRSVLDLFCRNLGTASGTFLMLWVMHKAAAWEAERGEVPGHREHGSPCPLQLAQLGRSKGSTTAGGEGSRQVWLGDGAVLFAGG